MKHAPGPTQTGQDTSPLLVSPAEACRMLGGCSDSHLRRLTARGLVEVRYMGRHRRILYSSLVAYVSGLPDAPEAAA